jgi:hypothetical protein
MHAAPHDSTVARSSSQPTILFSRQPKPTSDGQQQLLSQHADGCEKVRNFLRISFLVIFISGMHASDPIVHAAKTDERR